MVTKGCFKIVWPLLESKDVFQSLNFSIPGGFLELLVALILVLFVGVKANDIFQVGGQLDMTYPKWMNLY